MKLRFVKNTGKPHVIHYCRDNGTQTWMQADDYFVRHDLSHFTVEKALGYTTAFYGLINSGMEPNDFLVRHKRLAISLSNEAMHAESVANLFLMDALQKPVEDFDAVQRQALAESFPQSTSVSLTEEQIQKVRHLLTQLLFEWKELDSGQSLDLEIAV